MHSYSCGALPRSYSIALALLPPSISVVQAAPIQFHAMVLATFASIIAPFGKGVVHQVVCFYQSVALAEHWIQSRYGCFSNTLGRSLHQISPVSAACSRGMPLQEGVHGQHDWLQPLLARDVHGQHEHGHGHGLRLIVLSFPLPLTVCCDGHSADTSCHTSCCRWVLCQWLQACLQDERLW